MIEMIGAAILLLIWGAAMSICGYLQGNAAALIFGGGLVAFILASALVSAAVRDITHG